MAETLDLLTARLRALDDLSGLVGAMRTLSASRIQQAQGALPGVRAYRDVVAQACADALALVSRAAPPRGRGPTALVVLGAERGFAGGFHRRALDAAGGGAPLLVAGARTAVEAVERGRPPDFQTAMATHAGAVLDAARRLAAEVLRRFGLGTLGGAEVVHARRGAHGRVEVARRTLWPRPAAGLPAARRRPRPLVQLPPQRLAEKLLEELFVAELTLAAMESFAAESAARLEAMTAARRHLDERLAALRGEQRRLRQEAVTLEVLDLVAARAAASP